MDQQPILSRKSFIRILTTVGTGFFLWIWYRLSDHETSKENREEFRHKEDIPMGVSFFGKYYLYRKDESVLAFSTICTHAGCRIGPSNSRTLQCSCHGSRFDAATGKPLKGPAIHPLQELDCRLDSNTGQWIVRLHQRKEQQG